MEAIKVGGKEYKAKFISVLVLEELIAIMQEIAEAREKREWALYKEKWESAVALIFENPDGLNLDQIDLAQREEIVGFFLKLVDNERKKLPAGQESTPAS